MSNDLAVDAPFPQFDLPRDGEGRVSNADLAGAPFVMFFYPRDDTSGCTKEALAFSALAEEFSAANCAVFGLSGDSVASHEKFIKKHDLKIPLLADEDQDLCRKCGVWVEKSMYGRKFMGIERSSFLVDGAGVVRQIWRKVKVPGHTEAVLKAVKAL